MTATQERPQVRTVLRATITPLASIFGSGFLIIIPVLERTTGAWSVFAIAAVCALAWLVGTVTRRAVRTIEPLAESGALTGISGRLEKASDLVIVVAYVISVALYLRIMAQYVARGIGLDGQVAERGIACAAVAAIVVLGVLRGFQGLDALDRVALGGVLLLVALLVGYLLVHDIGLVSSGSVSLPPPTEESMLDRLRVLGGILIAVQGFETVRFLGDEFDTETRVWASRVAQLSATVVYVGFVLVATPVMGTVTGSPDRTLVDLVTRLAGWLVIPVVLVATLSQLAAALADTAAAEGNLRELAQWFAGSRGILVSGALAFVLAATVPTFTIVAVASRAFALYYALQCLVALHTAETWRARAFLVTLAGVLVAVVLLAEPVG